MNSTTAQKRLEDYAKGLVKWEDIVENCYDNHSCSINEQGNLVVMGEDGDVTHYTAKDAIDSIDQELCGMSILERKLERIHYYFKDKEYKKQI